MVDVDVYALSHLKEELAWVVVKRLWVINIISYSYIPLRVGYHCYYTSRGEAEDEC